jgi:hypothetical protein
MYFPFVSFRVFRGQILFLLYVGSNIWIVFSL